MLLEGKRILVTGGSRGIGRKLVKALDKEGAKVAFTYRDSVEEAMDLLKPLKDGIALKADVRDYDICLDVVKAITDIWGNIDILVNNAAISKVGLFTDMEPEEWQEILDTNLGGVFNYSRTVIPLMVKEKKGSIINISSIWGEDGASCEAVYSATKGALDSFTKSLAKELAPSNVRVNAVAPGVVQTEMNSIFSEEEMENIKGEIPLGKIASPNEIAPLVVFLASDSSSYVTGQIIRISGGL